jgi:hypothetical protein
VTSSDAVETGRSDVLRALADRQSITDLIYRYCRSVDRLDVPLGHSIWHDGAYADYGATVYQGDGRGVIDHICAQHRQTLSHSHQVTNILIELDGDEAGSESYHFACLRVAGGAQVKQISVWGRYLDRWSRRDGRWGLTRRLTVRDFDEIRDVVPMAQHDTGRRDPTDPSYDFLEGRAG